MKRFLLLTFIILKSYSIDRSSISTEMITYINYATNGLYFIVPHKLLVDSQKHLNELLQKYDLNIQDVENSQDWQRIYNLLLKRSQLPIFQQKALPIEKAPQLLNDAKLILKSFLPNSENVQKAIIESGIHQSSIRSSPALSEKDYIIKEDFGRLFTYSKLERTIQEKKLNHIKLPEKFLLIQNKRTGKFLPPNQAANVINALIKLYAHSFDAAARVGYEWTSYPYIFYTVAKKQERFPERGGLNKAAMRELEILCKESPFDIGFDNIFWNSKGDAVIIDTEFKGTHKNDCEKLQRYPVTQSSL